MVCDVLIQPYTHTPVKKIYSQNTHVPAVQGRQLLHAFDVSLAMVTFLLQVSVLQAEPSVQFSGLPFVVVPMEPFIPKSCVPPLYSGMSGHLNPTGSNLFRGAMERYAVEHSCRINGLGNCKLPTLVIFHISPV